MSSTSECGLRRIVVVGTSGSGKTTLATRIAETLGLPHVELDALNWGPNWTQASAELFRERVSQALKGPEWVVDGNYSRVRDVVWGHADTLVWLDYSLPVVLWRVISRTLRRSLTQEELWNENRETLRTAVFSRDGIIVFAVRSYRRRRKTYPQVLAQPEYAHLAVVRLRSPHAARRWLERLRMAAPSVEAPA